MSRPVRALWIEMMDKYTCKGCRQHVEAREGLVD